METYEDLYQKIISAESGSTLPEKTIAECYRYFLLKRDIDSCKKLLPHISDGGLEIDGKTTLFAQTVQNHNSPLVKIILEKNPQLIKNPGLWKNLFTGPEAGGNHNNFQETANFLISQGLSGEIVDDEGNNAAHQLFNWALVKKINKTLDEADLINKLTVVASASADYGQILTTENNAGQTPLELACQLGNYKAGKRALTSAGNFRAGVGQKYLNSLITNNALNEDSDRLLKILIKRKADPEKTNQHLVCWAANSINTLKYVFAQGYELDSRSPAAPLMIAAGNNDLEVAEYLINEKNVEVNPSRSYEEDTPLIAAINGRSEEMIEYLLAQEANVKVVSSKGVPALELAKLKCSQGLYKKIKKSAQRKQALDDLVESSPDVYGEPPDEYESLESLGIDTPMERD